MGEINNIITLGSKAWHYMFHCFHGKGYIQGHMPENWKRWNMEVARSYNHWKNILDTAVQDLLGYVARA